MEVLRLLADGNSTREMAESLNVTTSTVRKHVQNLFRAISRGPLRPLARKHLPPQSRV